MHVVLWHEVQERIGYVSLCSCVRLRMRVCDCVSVQVCEFVCVWGGSNFRPKNHGVIILRV